MFTATYSPDDNKLRLYASTRLDAETYAKAKDLGFKWAPKQDLFVAPMWTPQREDFLIELAGEVEDEDKSLVDRAEERAERFADYSDKRGAEAEHARKAVAAIADGIPLGQPILVGHHSERRARKDAERIENGMRKAVKLWRTSTYWTDRAAGALRHAKYKERPDVRARRIKGIESDLRKQEKNKAAAEHNLKIWSREGLTLAQAKHFANFHSFNLPRKEGDKEDWSHTPSAWDALDRLESGEPSTLYAPRTLEEVIEAARKHYPPFIESCARWLEHYQNRLAYERAMLAERIGAESAGGRFPFEVGGRVSVRRDGETYYTITRVNKASGAVNSLRLAGRKYVPIVGVEEVTDYEAPDAETAAKVKKAVALAPLCNYPGEGIGELTRAEWDKIHKDYKGSREHKATAERGRHRLRHAIGCYLKCPEDVEGTKAWAWKHSYHPVFVTDDKRKDAPPPDVDAPSVPKPERVAPPVVAEALEKAAPTASKDDEFRALEKAAKEGVKVVSAPQLFPTPVEIAEEMVALLDVQPGDRVLEPSAGTGRLLDALPDGCHVTAVEKNVALAQELKRYKATIFNLDFLDFGEKDGTVTYDRIIMNPPFENGADVKHVEHALKFLKPGGRLVALCANGPRQGAAFGRWRDSGRFASATWRALPPGSFKESGTNVNVALVMIDAPAALAQAAE